MIQASAEQRARMRDVTPMGHLQCPEDIYGAVIYLASQASNYVTGHNLVVDGGHTSNPWFEPLKRAVAPRVSPAGEIAEAHKDLETGGVPHNPAGIMKS
jgi:hypothetical protein